MKWDELKKSGVESDMKAVRGGLEEDPAEIVE